MIQHLLDGLLVGSILSLGAIGLTLVMHTLRFANFSHAELLSVGAYAALVFDGIFGPLYPQIRSTLDPLSLTWSLILAILFAMIVTGLSAILIDKLVFRRIREKGEELSLVFASFGIAMVVRNLISLFFGLKSQLFSNDIAFAIVISRDPMILVKPDQVFVLIAALLVMLLFHLILSRTTFGYALQAVAENPVLAQISGVNLSRMLMMIWLIEALAALSGIFYGLNNQINPVIGRDLVLPILLPRCRGNRTVYGAVL